MDDKTKDLFRKNFGPDTQFDDEQFHKAAKNLMPFVLARMKKLEECEHKIITNIFPLDERLKHCHCYCGKIEYIEMSKACHDEILIDPDLRNIMDHKVKQGKLIELFGIEVRIV